MDLGSLNGSMLNDRIISTSNRREGRAVRLSSDDILQLGSRTKLKVTCLPHQLSQVGFDCCVMSTAACELNILVSICQGDAVTTRLYAHSLTLPRKQIR